MFFFFFSPHSGLPANIQLDVDGDRETERIYSLFSTYMTKLVKMQGQTQADVCVYVRASVSTHANPACYGIKCPQIKTLYLQKISLSGIKKNTLIYR